ncbi:MAG: cell division protein ZapA [Stellaceae bacterium]
MAQVTVSINGRAYPVACNEGEEQRIEELGRYIDAKVKHFARELGQIGETRLLVLAALVLADELADAQSDAEGPKPGNGAALDEGIAAAGIENLAQRIEAIAARLEMAHI